MSEIERIRQTRAADAQQRKTAKEAGGATADRVALRAGPVSPAAARALQRRVGNRALGRMIQARLTVGPADDPYEREAERVAAQIAPAPQADRPDDDVQLSRRASAAADAAVVGPEGGEVDAHIERELASSQGGGMSLPPATRAQMEAHLGADLSDVRVHTGAQADRLNRQLGAQAFTWGSDIYMADGKYNPASRDGQRLLAHELTHVVQQAGGAARSARRKDDGIVRRKMKGTSQALAAVSKYGRRWNEIRKGVALYEELESAQSQALDELNTYAGKEGSASHIRYKVLNHQTADRLQRMRGLLITLEQRVLSWLWRHRESRGRRATAQIHALKMLLPRIRQEEIDITSGNFGRNIGFDDTKLTASRDFAVGGGMNKLDKVWYGEFVGYFKEEKSSEDPNQFPLHAENAGIPSEDPNFGARSVALYRLDRLLRADVIVRTEFAIKARRMNEHDTGPKLPKMGIVMEEARGTTAADARKNNRIRDLADPVLQRCLSKLQLLDALAGQVDRHMGNYLIETDEQGRVVGVKGIDNDLSFGAEIQDPTKEEYRGLGEYIGVPPVVDREMGEIILRISPDDVRSAVGGLLAESEVQALLTRLEKIKVRVQQLKDLGLLKGPDEWNAETAEQMGKGKKYKSYYGTATVQ